MRKQGLFLTLALVCFVAALAMPLAWFEPSGMGVGRIMNCMLVMLDGQCVSIAPIPMFILLVALCPLTLWATFARKRLLANPNARVPNRKLQMRLCSWIVALIALWYVAAAAVIYFLKGSDALHIQLPMCLPLIAALLTLLARHAIKADDNLIRSADRLR